MIPYCRYEVIKAKVVEISFDNFDHAQPMLEILNGRFSRGLDWIEAHESPSHCCVDHFWQEVCGYGRKLISNGNASYARRSGPSACQPTQPVGLGLERVILDHSHPAAEGAGYPACALLHDVR